MSAQYLDVFLEQANAGDLLSLRGDEARHAVKVARVGVGDNIIVFDGRGLQVFGEVTETGVDTDQRVFLNYRVQNSKLMPEPKLRTVLVQSLAKGGRDELAVQTATELGVWAVAPWQSDRSIVRWDQKKADKNRIRWQQIVTEAAKQSLNPFVPEIMPLVAGSKAFASLQDQNVTLLMLDPAAELSLRDVLQPIVLETITDQHEAGSDLAHTLVLFIGPEGGFSDTELHAIEATAGIKARMGNLVLRSSSAGPAALSIINQFSGTWD